MSNESKVPNFENPVIITERLILRDWQKDDFEPFAKLNADPRVMEYFLETLTREQSDLLAERICVKLKEQGWGLWATATAHDNRFIGFVGLNKVDMPVPFNSEIEIGWRLAYEFWGKGYATEAAKAVLKQAFENLKINQLVSFTSTLNIKSQKVMQKIGMEHNPEDDFDNPRIPEGHLLRPHVLYRLKP